MNCNEKGNAVSGVPDLPENNTADIKPEELPGICDRLYFRLTSTMLLSTAALVILAVGVLGIGLEFRHAGWIFVPFFIFLVVIYCVSIPLTQTAVSVFSKIGEIYPTIILLDVPVDIAHRNQITNDSDELDNNDIHT